MGSSLMFISALPLHSIFSLLLNKASITVDTLCVHNYYLQLLLLLVLYVFQVQSSTQVISRNLGSIARGHWRPRAGAWNHVVPKPVSREHSNTRTRNGRQGGKKLSSRKVKSTGGDSRDKRRTSRKFSPKGAKGLSLRKPRQEVRRTQPRGNKRGGQRRPGKQESNRRGRQVEG